MRSHKELSPSFSIYIQKSGHFRGLRGVLLDLLGEVLALVLGLAELNLAGLAATVTIGQAAWYKKDGMMSKNTVSSMRIGTR